MKRSGKLFRLFALLCSFLLPILFCPGNSASAQEPGLSLHLFSFGKADAFLLMTEEGTVLIDSGESGQGKEILNFLEEKGITEIDTFILTHFDKDHVGGAAKVLKGIPVRRVLQSDCPRDNKEYSKYLSALALCRIEPVTVREPISFSLGDVDFTVVPPMLTVHCSLKKTTTHRDQYYESMPTHNETTYLMVLLLGYPNYESAIPCLGYEILSCDYNSTDQVFSHNERYCLCSYSNRHTQFQFLSCSTGNL